MEIQRLKEAHVPGLLETLTDLSTVGTVPLRKQDRAAANIMNNLWHRIFVAVERGKVIGAGTLLIEQKFIHGASFLGHIEDVVIRKECQGKGIGSLIVGALIAEAAESGCYRVNLDCSNGNMPFYARHGFKPHGIEMRLDLPPRNTPVMHYVVEGARA